MRFDEAPERYRTICRMKEQIDSLRAKAMGGSSFSADERVQTSGAKDPTIYLDAAADIEKYMTKQVEILQQERQAALDFIQSLPDARDRQIIKLRYIDYRSMSEIADVMGYSLQHLRRKRSKILRNLK